MARPYTHFFAAALLCVHGTAKKWLWGYNVAKCLNQLI